MTESNEIYPLDLLIESVDLSNEEIIINWSNDKKSKYHYIWLRDNCRCEYCYYDITKQRLLNSCTINLNIKPLGIKNYLNQLIIVWDQNNHKSKYLIKWLILHSYNPQLIPLNLKIKDQINILKQNLWSVNDIKNNLPIVDYNEIIKSSNNNNDDLIIKDWCLKIWNFGFCFINNVPINPKDTEKLCEKITFIRPTHYGGFWDFTNDLSKNDTAYTNIDISSHTDGTYWSDAPGLQLFHLLYHDGNGGESSLIDGFNCAKILKEKFLDDYKILTKIPIPAHSAGEETVCIQPDIPQPILKLNNQNELIQIRWNQSDRSTMNNLNPNDVPKFYKAIKNWHEIISNKENVFFFKLKPGQCLIFDNWRCLHSRTDFTGKRRLCGAYLHRDDFISRLNLLSLGRQNILNTL